MHGFCGCVGFVTRVPSSRAWKRGFGLQGASAALTQALTYLAVCGTTDVAAPWPLTIGVHMEPSQTLAATLSGACTTLADTDSASQLLNAACAMPYGVAEAPRPGAAPVGRVSAQWQLSLKPPTAQDADLAAAAGSGRGAVGTRGQSWGVAVGVVFGCLLVLVAAVLSARYALRRARGAAYAAGGASFGQSESGTSGASSSGEEGPEPGSASGGGADDASGDLASRSASGTDEAAPRISTVDPSALQSHEGSEESEPSASGDEGASRSNSSADGESADGDEYAQSGSGTTGSESEG